MSNIKPSEITPERVYLDRRRFMVGLGAALGSAGLLAGCAPSETPTVTSTPTTATERAGPTPTSAPTTATEAVAPTPTSAHAALEGELTDLDAITGYTNFYEFTTSKEGVASLARDFKTSPWLVDVGGMVNNPRTFDLDALLGFTQEERIYRMRCVEAWSMVIPWTGFRMSLLLDVVEPRSDAKFVRFETLFDPEQMPGQKRATFPWPYVEGLRLDEAMHELTILATGLYGKPLLPQNGAPVRLVVPWKYGFKSIKSIVKIDLVEEMPVSLWMASGPREYGFWANVNPEVSHPRWSQATERRIGEGKRRETLLFNGYADEVAHLYSDIDSREWYY